MPRGRQPEVPRQTQHPAKPAARRRWLQPDSEPRRRAGCAATVPASIEATPPKTAPITTGLAACNKTLASNPLRPEPSAIRRRHRAGYQAALGRREPAAGRLAYLGGWNAGAANEKDGAAEKYGLLTAERQIENRCIFFRVIEPSIRRNADNCINAPPSYQCTTHRIFFGPCLAGCGLRNDRDLSGGNIRFIERAASHHWDVQRGEVFGRDDAKICQRNPVRPLNSLH